MKILFVQSGGTIDKDYPTKVKSYAFEFGDPAFLSILEKADPNFEFESVCVFKKDSLDMTDEDRQKIYDICKDTPHDKIIMTHGTDTMTTTAEKLSTIAGKTIIITGSLIPEKFITSDADFNVGTAVGAINVLSQGVYIAMSGRIYRWDTCQKDQTTGQFVEKDHYKNGVQSAIGAAL